MTPRRLVTSWFKVVWRCSGFGLTFIVAMSVVVAFLAAAFPWLWQFLVEEVEAGARPVELRELALLMALVGVTNFVCYTLIQGARSIMNGKIERRARRRVYAHLSRLELDFYRRWRTGDLVTRLSDDAGEKIAWFLCSGVFRAFEAALIIVACLIGMIIVDPALTVWVVLPLPLLILGQAAAQGALGRRFKRVQEAISSINDELATTFAGIRIVQACELQQQAKNRFSARAEEQKSAEVSTAIVQQTVYMQYGYGWQAAVVALLIAGGVHVIDGTITLGQFVTFEGFVMTLVWPMFDFGTFLSRYKQTFVALTRLQELVDEPVRPNMDGGEKPTVPSIVLENASVAVEDATLLSELSLKLGPGELIAVVGGVGSGKTTLVEVLAGARPISTGAMTVGGWRPEELDQPALRSFIGYVPQDPVLLSTTIKENILLGRALDEHALEEALSISRLEQDLPAFPNNLETAVGERGVTLSGGQQQRVALARALVGKPAILLLDDATAALDADTEAAFWQALESVLSDVAAVVVTHRTATIQRADRIIVLEDGAIVQEGRHADLIDLPGAYRELYGTYEAEAKVKAL